jgi:hypothetical protein
VTREGIPEERENVVAHAPILRLASLHLGHRCRFVLQFRDVF